MTVVEIPHDLIGSSGLYNSPDPLLRRLRLEEQSGTPVTDLQKTFGEVEVLVLYAGSRAGAENLDSFHRALTVLHMRQRSVAVIYVSTDTDPKLFTTTVASFPWYRMTFFDDSDFAPLAYSAPEAVEVSRGENFVQAGEIEVGAEAVPYGEDEYIRDYVRPLSRAAVAISMNAYRTPSIAVYHLGTHRFVAKNIKPAAFDPKNVNASLRTWRAGGTPSIGLAELWATLKWPLIALLLAVLYHALVFFGGDKYHFIPKVLDELNWRTRALTGR